MTEYLRVFSRIGRVEFIISVGDYLLLSFFIFLAITGSFIKTLLQALHEYDRQPLWRTLDFFVS